MAVNTTRSETNISERLKAELLDDLHLMRPVDWEAYWRQAKWPKPSLNASGRQHNPTQNPRHPSSAHYVSPIRYALNRLPSDFVAEAEGQPNPFVWILERMDVGEWSRVCRRLRVPWMTRVWQATASQLRGQRTLIFKAHGWSDTWENLRRNPTDLRAAEDFFAAQLSHARGQRRTELLAIRLAGLDEASLRRLRRARKAHGKRAGVPRAAKFMVQYWLELPQGFPGLCFFSDVGLHSLFEILGLSTGEGEATKQIRERLGLIQAGVKRHFVEEVVAIGHRIKFTGDGGDDRCSIDGKISWGRRRLWPPS